MGHIKKDQLVYDANNKPIYLGAYFVEEGSTPISKKYPGGNLTVGFAHKGKHTGSHKPIKNHRGKIVHRH